MSLLSGAIGALGGFITGGPVGAVIGGFAGAGQTRLPAPASIGLPLGGMPLPTPGFLGGIFDKPQTMPFGLPTVGQVTGTNWGSPSLPAGGCPRGYHPNKHALAASKRHGAVAARSMCVRNRHVNPLNPRALKRALRREKSAGKIIRRLHVFRPVHHTSSQKRLPARTR